MRILLVSEYFYPHWTGIAKAFLVLAQQLAKEGHKVSVLTTQFDPALTQNETYGKTHIIRMPYLFRLLRTHYSPQTIFRAPAQIGKNDIVIINSPHSNILPLSLMAKLLGKRLYIFHQGDLMLPKKTGVYLFHWVVERVFDVMTIGAMACANGVSTYTRDYAKRSRVLHFFLHKFFPYIPPFSLSQKKPSSAKSALLKKLKKNHVLVGFAGRFVEEKGFDVLFKAIPHVVKTMPRTHFVFAGQKHMGYEPFFEKYRALFESQAKHVTYLGLLDEADLAFFYRSLDVFVVSSRSDCFPLTQIEAALWSVPIVATNIPGSRVLVHETGTGVLVPPENPHALSKGIITAITHRQSLLKNAALTHSFLKKYDTFKLA